MQKNRSFTFTDDFVKKKIKQLKIDFQNTIKQKEMFFTAFLFFVVMNSRVM